MDEAVRCALALQSENPDYVWRRLRCISLEEVSVADLQLVAQVIAIAGKRVLQRKLGTRKLLAMLTTRLAEAPKSRTACDLLVWLPPDTAPVGQSRHPAFDAGTLLTCDPAELRQAATLWQSVAPRSIRTRAGWKVVSRGDTRSRDAWLEAAGVPPLVRFIVQRGGNTDALNVLLVPAYQLAQGGLHELSTEAPLASSLARINDVPAYSYCLYSGPGRSALRHFLATHPLWQGKLRALGVTDALRAMGNLVFHVEGDYCSRAVGVARGAEIKAHSEATTLAACGVPATAISGLEEQVIQALPGLNASRRAIGANHG